MIVEQIWTGNDYRNFNYVIACGETGEALAIDPLDPSTLYAGTSGGVWDIVEDGVIVFFRFQSLVFPVGFLCITGIKIIHFLLLWRL